LTKKNLNILYIGVEGRGIYKSIDQGKTWKKSIKGLVAYPDMNNKVEMCFPDIAAIYIDSEDNQKLLMVTSDITSAYIDWPYGETGGIWESLDGGESWRQMIKGNINVAGSGNLAIDPKNNKIMYYPVNPDIPTFEEAPIKESLNKKGSVYKTTDGGISWEELKMPMLPSLQAVVIAIDPENSNHLLFFTQSHDHIYGESSITEVFLHQQHGILESFDGGKTWVAIGDTLPDPYRTLFDGDVSKNNLIEALKELTNGEMADVVIVGPNSAEAMKQGIGSTGAGGKVLFFTPAKPDEKLILDPNELYFKDINIITSYSCGPTDTADALEIIESGIVSAEKLEAGKPAVLLIDSTGK